MADKKGKTFEFMVVGGGIAGVTCVEQVKQIWVKNVGVHAKDSLALRGTKHCHALDWHHLSWQLASQMPSANVALITAGPHIKAVTNYKQVRVRERQRIMDGVIVRSECDDKFPMIYTDVKLFNCFSLHCLSYCQPRFPKYLRSLKSRSNRPPFWRRDFPTLPSSTLLSSHLIHKHMQVSYWGNKMLLYF